MTALCRMPPSLLRRRLSGRVSATSASASAARACSRAASPACRAERWIGARMSSCRYVASESTRSAPGTERRDSSTRARCRRCRRDACRRARSRPRPWAAGGRCARSAARHRRGRGGRRRRPSPVERVAPIADETLEQLLHAFRCEHRKALALEAVLVHHVQAVQVDAVVGMAVRDDDRRQLSGSTCCCRFVNEPLPQSTQSTVVPARTR